VRFLLRLFNKPIAQRFSDGNFNVSAANFFFTFRQTFRFAAFFLVVINSRDKILVLYGNLLEVDLVFVFVVNNLTK